MEGVEIGGRLLVIPVEHSQKYHDMPDLVRCTDQIEATIEMEQIFRKSGDVEAQSNTTNYEGDHHRFQSEQY